MLVGLVGDHLTLRDFGPYLWTYMFITDAVIMLLMDFGPYGTIFTAINAR